MEQTNGRCVAVVAGAKAHAVDVGGDDVGRLIGRGGVQQEDLLESGGTAQAADIQNQQGGDGGQDGGDGNVQALLEAVCAVQLSSLVQFGVDAGHGSQVKDGAPAEALPYARGNKDRREPLGQGDEGDGLAAQLGDEVVDGTAGGQNLADHARNDDHRDEVGQVGDRLHNLLEVNILDLVQQQGEDQRQREADDQILEVQQQCVLERTPEVLILHELVEVLQAAPFIAEDAAAGAVAAERNDVAEHRDVAEHDVVHNGNEHHCVPLPVLFNVLHHGTLLLDSGHRSAFLCGLGHGSVSPS